MLGVLPIGVIVFAGTGIRDNLADKARKLGIPLFDSQPKPGGGRAWADAGIVRRELRRALRQLGQPIDRR